jgi:hypothetical protein
MDLTDVEKVQTITLLSNVPAHAFAPIFLALGESMEAMRLGLRGWAENVRIEWPSVWEAAKAFYQDGHFNWTAGDYHRKAFELTYAALIAIKCGYLSPARDLQYGFPWLQIGLVNLARGINAAAREIGAVYPIMPGEVPWASCEGDATPVIRLKSGLVDAVLARSPGLRIEILGRRADLTGLPESGPVPCPFEPEDREP